MFNTCEAPRHEILSSHGPISMAPQWPRPSGHWRRSSDRCRSCRWARRRTSGRRDLGTENSRDRKKPRIKGGQWVLSLPEEFGQFGTMILTQLSILHSCGRLLVITGDFYGILHPSTYMYLSHLITGITRAITASFTISKKRPDVHLGPKVPKVEAGLRTMEPGWSSDTVSVSCDRMS